MEPPHDGSPTKFRRPLATVPDETDRDDVPGTKDLALCSASLGANRIQHLLGDRFVLAMEKLMGLILVAVGIEMLVRGYRALLASL